MMQSVRSYVLRSAMNQHYYYTNSIMTVKDVAVTEYYDKGQDALLNEGNYATLHFSMMTDARIG